MPRKRAELIAGYAYGRMGLAVPPPPATDAPAGGKPFEPAPYKPDADETVICPSCECHNDPDASFCDQCGTKLAGDPDVTVEEPAEPDAAESLAPVVTLPPGPDPAPVANEEPASALNLPPEVEGGQAMGPAFTIPVAVIEGQPTGDGREIAVGALTWRTPPLPLMGLATETHDPEGWDLNDPAVLCGRIDSIERAPGEGDTQVLLCRGFFLPNEDGMYFAGLAEGMGRLGVSADIAVTASEITGVDIDQDGFPVSINEILAEGVLMGVTCCPFPAFEGAYLVLGDGTVVPDAQAIPQAAEAPVTPPQPPASVLAGGQLVHFISTGECEPCDRGLEVVVASGAGPTRPPAAWFADPAFTVGDGRLVEILNKRGEREYGGKYACPITIEDDGRVYGHLAPWDVCHIGQPGGCITAPHSQADYAHFLRGYVVTADGSKVRVGTLTCDAAHASTSRGTTAGAAMAHYDDTATGAADVVCGDDEFGIWVAGAMRPDATEEQIRKLRASSVSGDWRSIGGALELVAALAVPVPGFPHSVVREDRQETLVASGALVMHRLKHPVQEQGVDAGLRRALAPMLAREAREASRRLATSRLRRVLR